MTTDWKALCAELVNSWTEGLNIVGPMHHARALLSQPEPPSRLHHCPTHGQQPENAWGCPECVREMRQQLAQPEPEGPGPVDYRRWHETHSEDCNTWSEQPTAPLTLRTTVEALAWANYCLARWGRPVVEPVPVSKRLPGPKDCWPDGHEKVGCCWLWTPVDGLGRWEVQHRDWASEPGESYTHWLPYYALPVRTPTETNGQA